MVIKEVKNKDIEKAQPTDKCPQCNHLLVNNECKLCKIRIEK